MGICGSKEKTTDGRAPLERAKVRNGTSSEVPKPKQSTEEETGTKPEIKNNDDIRNVGNSNKSENFGNENNTQQLQTPRGRETRGISTDFRDGDVPTTDERDSDPVPDLQVTDFNESEEFTQQLQQNYKRKPNVLTRKDLLADVYKMDFPRRGMAIVINNEQFKNSPSRKGTYIDFSKICNRLEKLGFHVERFNDLTCRQMMEVFQRASKIDHSDADCFACVLLSHGGSDEIHGTDGELRLSDIFSLFRSDICTTLAGKPKLFFVQACRGEDFDDGADINYTQMNVTDAQSGNTLPEEEVQLAIPEEADFLICYSTVSGYYSWRNSQKGSWYIQALVKVLDECGTVTEIKKIMTKVNKLVAYEYESTAPKHTRKKQIPSFNSKLTKDLYFIPK